MLIEHIVTEQMLDEVAMNPNALRKAVAQINARAGMEFELYVPGVGNTDEDGEFSDDNDERAETFGNIEYFFDQSDQFPLRDIQSMIEEMQNQYREEFVYDALMDGWSEVMGEAVAEYIEYNQTWDQTIDEYRSSIEEVFDEYFETDGMPDNPWDDDWDNEQIQAAIEENNLEREVYERASEYARDEQNSDWENARDQWEQDNYEEIFYDEDNQRTWLSNSGNGWMSDVVENFGHNHDIYMPSNGGGDAESNLEAIADEFSQVVGKHTNYSGSYHGGARNAGEYTIEPDSSLNDRNDYDDAGLEFISPPMSISEMLDDLDAIVAWADQKGVYTNSTTGLHMNIDTDNYSRENLDFIKLVLLMGDKYVLEQFNRSYAYYAKSMYTEVENAIQNQDYNLVGIFDKMKQDLGKEASKAIHSGNTGKFSSVNVKDKWVEFRGPGDDWLNGDIELVKNTLMRFVVALDAACDPEKYKNEYLKKLYKMAARVANKNQVDITQAFAKYATGDLDKAGLKQVISQRMMNTRDRKNKQAGIDMRAVADKIGTLYKELTAYDYGSGDTLSTQFESSLHDIANAFQENGQVKKRLEELLDRIEVADSVQSWDASKVLLQWLKGKYAKV